jgi:hypothetical protein
MDEPLMLSNEELGTDIDPHLSIPDLGEQPWGEWFDRDYQPFDALQAALERYKERPQ